MPHTPSTAEPAKRPEGDGAGVPQGIARLLLVLQWLIGYGQTVAATLHQRSATDLRRFTERYRRPDINEILARIRRGVMLAAALRDKLLARAKTGRDLTPVKRRHSIAHANPAADGSDKRSRVCPTNIVDMPADQLPTAEQIAAELQRRPLGAVLADICRDLGVRPGDMTREQWQELQGLILDHGGFASDVLFAEDNIRLKALVAAELGTKQPVPAQRAAPPRENSACPTGPPPLALAA